MTTSLLFYAFNDASNQYTPIWITPDLKEIEIVGQGVRGDIQNQVTNILSSPTSLSTWASLAIAHLDTQGLDAPDAPTCLALAAVASYYRHTLSDYVTELLESKEETYDDDGNVVSSARPSASSTKIASINQVLKNSDRWLGWLEKQPFNPEELPTPLDTLCQHHNIISILDSLNTRAASEAAINIINTYVADFESNAYGRNDIVGSRFINENHQNGLKLLTKEAVLVDAVKNDDADAPHQSQIAPDIVLPEAQKTEEHHFQVSVSMAVDKNQVLQWYSQTSTLSVREWYEHEMLKWRINPTPDDSNIQNLREIALQNGISLLDIASIELQHALKRNGETGKRSCSQIYGYPWEQIKATLDTLTAIGTASDNTAALLFEHFRREKAQTSHISDAPSLSDLFS